MFCKSCHDNNCCILNGEIAIHFPGLNGLNKPIIWVFPKIKVCLECGSAEFRIPEEQIGELAESNCIAA